MSEIKVNKISPRTNCGTTTLGDSGDTFTIPAGVTITNNGTQTGFGRTGTVDWDTTAKTASFTAVSGNGYFCNTTSGAITVTLPASPSAGDIVSLSDYTNTWQTNAVTVARNGSNIGGVAADASLSTEGQSVTFVYVDGTEGWKNVQDSTSNVTGNPNLVATGGTITTCGDYKIHTFTGPGTFTVSQVSQTAADNTVSYLVAAGGGGGGYDVGGGGGGGGFREYRAPVSGCYAVSPLNGNPGGTAITVTAQAYPITVGAGGTSGNGCSPTSRNGGNGGNSIFSTVTSTGGGGGGGYNGNNGVPGGSGGGGAGYGPTPTTGGTGNTPPVSPSQGGNGGSNPGSCTQRTGGGGGGATSDGSNSTVACTGSVGGGDAATSSINGSPTARSAGGKGVGDGFSSPVSGAANTGNGADGNGNPATGATGGSGIVIIRYKYQ